MGNVYFLSPGDAVPAKLAFFFMEPLMEVVQGGFWYLRNPQCSLVPQASLRFLKVSELFFSDSF